mmetsp:Transcript_5086/g.7729  ORF Transcript_5086/g.7729 Transcript_5086/m.7729 type:complete len:91 (+) Transcript_5086:3-275(+)
MSDFEDDDLLIRRYWQRQAKEFIELPETDEDAKATTDDSLEMEGGIELATRGQVPSPSRVAMNSSPRPEYHSFCCCKFRKSASNPISRVL